LKTNENGLAVGIVGLGKLGLLHAGVFQALSSSRLVAVVDPSRTAVDVLVSRDSGIQGYSDHKQMINDGLIDLAVIAVPTQYHVPIASDFVEAGIPFFVEKPLSRNYEEGLVLCRLLHDYPVVNMCGYMTRFQSSFVKAKSLIESGVLGSLQFVRGTMYSSQLFGKGKGWRYDPNLSGGGVLITQNSHLFDLLIWFFGNVAAVTAKTLNLYSEKIEDHAHVMVDFESGLTGFFDSGWSVRGYRVPSISIIVQGLNGELKVTDDDVILSLERENLGYASGRYIWRAPDLYDPVPFDIGGGHYTREGMAFLSAIEGKSTVESDCFSALKVQKVLDGIFASARAGGVPYPLEGMPDV